MTQDLSVLWQRALGIIEQQMATPAFNTWLRSTHALDFMENTLVIGVDTDFACDWLSSRYYNLIQSTLHEILSQDVEVRFCVATPDGKPIQAESQTTRRVSHSEPTENLQLNNKYSFDTFVSGNSNRFAHAAALAVAEAPAKSYNPLFIYGGVGLGKTHLMHAIGHFILSNHPDYKVVYVSCEKFTNELITSIQNNRTIQFRNKYRHVDVLMVDDIQFLEGKESTQEEFFHTFNSLYEASKQIILSSDRPPKEIATLEERLRSRFGWGLITDIQPPEFETRIAILRQKAQLEKIEIPSEVIIHIANRIDTNIRELEGALIRVAAHASLNQIAVTIELAEETLRDLLPAYRPKQYTIASITKTVADYFHLSLAEFQAKKRTRNIAFPRQIAMYLCRELLDTSLPRIGEEFGGRDHTTVIHACEKINACIKNDPAVASMINELVDLLKNS